MLKKTIKHKKWPEGYPISFEKAKELVSGSLGQAYKDIALSYCAPLLWFRTSDSPPRILHSGTITLVKSPKKLFGITAAHVLEQYTEDSQDGAVRLQLKDQIIEDLKIIDCSAKRDLATVELDEEVLNDLGLTTLDWPPCPPVEGRGLFLAGYPSAGRVLFEPMEVDWSPFFGITTARTVTDDQITILLHRNEDTRNVLPPNCNLGGISGGPIIGIFENDSHISVYRLSGVITEHPDYITNEFSIERVAGARADVITELGNIR